MRGEFLLEGRQKTDESSLKLFYDELYISLIRGKKLSSNNSLRLFRRRK